MKGVRGSGKPCAVEGCGKQSKAYGYCTAHGHRFRRHGDPLGGGPTMVPPGSLKQWIIDHVDHEGADECLIWPFYIERHGYSRVRHDGRREMAHRYMCELKHGPAPSPIHEAAHSCGRGADGCMNPNHLRWATPAENQADRIIHGTDMRGAKNHNTKLTADQVREIRDLEGKLSRQEIGDLYGVTRQNVIQIQQRKSWAWLDAEELAA